MGQNGRYVAPCCNAGPANVLNLSEPYRFRQLNVVASRRNWMDRLSSSWCGPQRLALLALLFACAVTCRTNPARAADDAEGARFFESKVRPILESNCTRCHG